MGKRGMPMHKYKRLPRRKRLAMTDRIAYHVIARSEATWQSIFRNYRLRATFNTYRLPLTRSARTSLRIQGCISDNLRTIKPLRKCYKLA